MTKFAKRVVFLIVVILILGGGIATIYLMATHTNNSDVSTVSDESSSAVVTLNCLTGEPISSDAANKKPVGIMVENSKQALPQWGLSSADVVYETLAEGGVTRNLAMFADSSSIAKTGPVRSVRKYYPPLACPSNALFVHFGGSDSGYNAIKSCGLDELDGLKDSAAFAQDSSRVSRGKEHSYYTSSAQFMPVAEKKGFAMQQTNNSAFLFGTTKYTDGQATDVSFSFSDYCPGSFSYDTASNTYLKSEFGQPQIDANNERQISVTNVLLLYANISNDTDGSSRQQIDYVQGGSGYYLSQGKYTRLRWSKQNDKENITLMDMEGSAIAINPGKTWVCILPDALRNSTKITPASPDIE